MKLRIYFGLTKGIFALPCEVADTYIADAPADALRVLIYLYRNGGALESETLCRALHIDEKKLFGALAYWSDKQLFTMDDTPGKAAAEAAAQAAPAPQAPPASAKEPLRRAPIEPMPQYTATDIANRAKGSDEIRCLFDTAPTLLGHLLSPSDCSILLYLHDVADLPVDVILMLLEYCAAKGHTNLHYVEKVGLSWMENGIDEHGKAEAYIRREEERQGYEGKVRAALGIAGRALAPSERKYLACWANDWQTPLELVQTAFDICVKRTGRLSMAYIHSILKTWHEKGYHTAEEARKESRGVKKGQAAKASTYDLNEYVDLSVKRLLKKKDRP